MVCCLDVGRCFGVAPHHVPDHVVTLAWHTRHHKIRSQIHELTCEAWHVYIWKGFGSQCWDILGHGSLVYITLVYYFLVGRMHGAFEHLPYAFLSTNLNFGHYGVVCLILLCYDVILMGLFSKPNRLQVQPKLCQGRAWS